MKRNGKRFRNNVLTKKQYDCHVGLKTIRKSFANDVEIKRVAQQAFPRKIVR